MSKDKMQVMYVWEVSEVSCIDGSVEHTLIKDDNESLSKIKKEVLNIIYHEIAECEDRIGNWNGVSTSNLENYRDWSESMQNKLSKVSEYECISQFKRLELLGCIVYVNKVEVI